MSDPGGFLEDLASGLRAHASALRAAGSAPSTTLAVSGWQGNRAADLHGRLEDPRRALEQIADECEQLAVSADSMAGQYAASVRLMLGYESEVRHWLGTLSPAVHAGLPWAVQLPASGSPEWSTILGEMHRAGG